MLSLNRLSLWAFSYRYQSVDNEYIHIITASNISETLVGMTSRSPSPVDKDDADWQELHRVWKERMEQSPNRVHGSPNRAVSPSTRVLTPEALPHGERLQLHHNERNQRREISKSPQPRSQQQQSQHQQQQRYRNAWSPVQRRAVSAGPRRPQLHKQKPLVHIPTYRTLSRPSISTPVKDINADTQLNQSPDNLVVLAGQKKQVPKSAPSMRLQRRDISPSSTTMKVEQRRTAPSPQPMEHSDSEDSDILDYDELQRQFLSQTDNSSPVLYKNSYANKRRSFSPYVTGSFDWWLTDYCRIAGRTSFTLPAHMSHHNMFDSSPSVATLSSDENDDDGFASKGQHQLSPEQTQQPQQQQQQQPEDIYDWMRKVGSNPDMSAGLLRGVSRADLLRTDSTFSISSWSHPQSNNDLLTNSPPQSDAITKSLPHKKVSRLLTRQPSQHDKLIAALRDQRVCV